jgi:hypothetical protein
LSCEENEFKPLVVGIGALRVAFLKLQLTARQGNKMSHIDRDMTVSMRSSPISSARIPHIEMTISRKTKSI